jgi:glycosyltransferase involved in cell wall biosynthesis
MFEALGLGLPFIGTNVGGIPEIIVSDDYGFLIESKNSKLLAEKILVALDKRWDREKIQKYSSKFTWESIALKTLSIYDEM